MALFLGFEALEDRRLLSVGPAAAANGQAKPTFAALIAPNPTAHFNYVAYHPIHAGGSGASPADSSSPTGFFPTQIQTAYGLNTLLAANDNGSGQTIAIVDAYNDPTIASDAAEFNTQFGLPQFNTSGVPQAGVPSLTVLNQTAQASPLPTNSDTTGNTDLTGVFDRRIDRRGMGARDRAQANIVLFEANSLSYSDLLTAVQYAGAYTGVGDDLDVSVVSMSGAEAKCPPKLPTTRTS